MNKRAKSSGAKAAARATVGVSLTSEAARLLARLGEVGAYARPDPLTEDGLLVRRGGDGVSVGSGRFS
ncbi:ATPase, partial [Methylobacterium sp. WL18]